MINPMESERKSAYVYRITNMLIGLCDSTNNTKNNVYTWELVKVLFVMSQDST